MTIKMTKAQETTFTALTNMVNQGIVPKEALTAFLDSVSLPKVRAKMPIECKVHTAKESGKLSIYIGQGRRVAYLNADQVNFILDNAELLQGFVNQLTK